MPLEPLVVHANAIGATPLLPYGGPASLKHRPVATTPLYTRVVSKEIALIWTSSLRTGGSSLVFLTVIQLPPPSSSHLLASRCLYPSVRAVTLDTCSHVLPGIDD